MEPKAIIKVIVNYKQPKKYSIIKTVHPTEILNILINVGNVEYDLDYICNCIKNDIIVKRKYNVIFNFKSTPPAIKNNIKFKNFMLSIFQAPKNSVIKSYDIETSCDIINFHIDAHNNHPNFNNYYKPNQMVKISNYIKHILNNKDLDSDTIMKILLKILEK